jgi:hypothetical protein
MIISTEPNEEDIPILSTIARDFHYFSGESVKRTKNLLELGEIHQSRGSPILFVLFELEIIFSQICSTVKSWHFLFNFLVNVLLLNY